MHGLLQDHYHIQPFSDCGTLCRVFYNPVSSTRGEVQANRGMLIQTETFLSISLPLKPQQGGWIKEAEPPTLRSDVGLIRTQHDLLLGCGASLGDVLNFLAGFSRL